METFTIKFRAGNLDLDAIVTSFDHNQKFKVEMVTNEPEPILLMRSLKGEWSAIQRGSRNFSEADFEHLQNAIETQMNEIYSVKNMLILTDFSETALNAAKYAAALTHQFKTKNMVLYHSYESITFPMTTIPPGSAAFTESAEVSRQKLAALKNELEKLVDENTRIDSQTDDRTLVTAVNTFVKQQHTGLIVAGITGKSNLEKILVGSNTISLAKYVEAPLLIVPRTAVFRPVKKVVFACDLKQVSASTPAYAIKTFINTLGARLLILNVDREGKYFNPDTIIEMTELHQLWDNERPEYHYIDHEDIATGIIDFAVQQQADLVITVPKSYGFFESLFHRSLTNKLAYKSHLPLLLFKEDQ